MDVLEFTTGQTPLSLLVLCKFSCPFICLIELALSRFSGLKFAKGFPCGTQVINRPPALVTRGYCPSCRQFYPHSVHVYLQWYCKSSGTAVEQWLRCCATNRKVAGSITASVSEFFIDIKSFRSHYGPGVDSASSQEHFLGGKGGLCVRLTTLPSSCAVVIKTGNFNFLEPSGPLQAFTFTFTASLLDNTNTCATELPGVICSAWIAHYFRHGFSFVQIWVFLCNLE